MMKISPWIFCLATGAASAGQLSLHKSLDTFLAASGPGVQWQDFESFAGTPVLDGLELLPGVTMDTNTAAVRSRAHSDGTGASATHDGTGASATHGGTPEMWLDTHLPAHTTAVAFDILYIDGGTGPGLISVFFAPGTPGLTQLDLPVPARNTDISVSRDQFFGITGDLAITRVRYTYGQEFNGECCEEIVYDNLRVLTAPVPEPASAALLLAGLGWLAGAATTLNGAPTMQA